MQSVQPVTPVESLLQPNEHTSSDQRTKNLTWPHCIFSPFCHFAYLIAILLQKYKIKASLPTA